MPLLRRQPFTKAPVPTDLRPDEELFFCKLTKEVFRDYDAFFERVILCNSLVWTCELSGRPGLTYQEAVESEGRARDTLRAMPISMRKPLLYLAYISRCGRLSDLCDEVFLYAKDRFFVGEEVDALINGQRAPCKIVKVVPPGNSSKRKQSFAKLMSSDITEDEDAADAAPHYDPSKCQYMVLDCKSSDREIHLLAPEDILRKKGVFSRERSKLFLKQTCHLSGCIWAVKEKFVEKYGIGRMKFRDIFAGARPSFESEPSRKRGIVPLPSQQAAVEAANNKAKSGKDAGLAKKTASSKTNSAANNGNKGASKSGADSKKMSNAIRKQIEADEEATRQAEALAAFEERRRAKEELRVKMEEDRRRRKEEREKEREQLKEERRIMAECLKEWQKPRDDLECDDLVDMPAPVPVVCGIPNEMFGEAAMLLEFVHSFGEMLETRDRFPQGLTLEAMERALVDCDVQGPLNDLLQLLLRAVFRFQEEDDEDDGSCGTGTASCSDGAVTAALGLQQTDDLDIKRAQQVAAAAANWPTYCHGASLRKLTLDAFNLTEVLRLHLLSSGARKNPEDPTSSDDPCFSLWLQEPELVRTLAHTNVFDLPAAQKLKILCTLADQLLGFYNLREEVDENLEKARLARNDLRSMQWAEQRREREEASLRFKKKMEERANVKTETEVDKKDAKTSKGDKAKKVLTVEEQKHEDEKQAERDTRRKQEFLRKEKEIAESVAHFQGRGALLPIGRDRAYRRFWMFANLPGLFVEDDDQELGPCPAEPTPYNPNSNPYASFNSSINHVRSQQLNGTGDAVVGDKENDAVKGAAVPPNGLPGSHHKKNHKLLSDNHPTTGAVVKSELVDGAVDVRIKMDDGVTATDSEVVANGKPTIFGMCNALDNACPVHGAKTAGTRWSFFSSSTQVEALIAALNPRGFREGGLKEILVADKRRVLQSVSRCPVSRLNPIVLLEGAGGEETSTDVALRKSNRFSQPIQATYPPNTTMEDFLELTLRDSIVDIEDKIHAGGLGSIKVVDRTAWREAIMQHSYDKQCDHLRWGVKLENRKLVFSESGSNGSTTSPNPKPCRVGSPVPTKSVVTDLASAMLQIFQGIELKYLTPPLAGDKDGASHKSASERWEEALVSCTSLSQVFLFLTTLEKSVAWSRSALNARCRICRRRGDAEHMLLCDECDRGHHMYCLKPRLKNIPEGDWLCPDCKPVEKPKKSRKRRPTQEEEEEGEEMDIDQLNVVPESEAEESSSDGGAEPPPKKKREDPKKDSSKRELSTRDSSKRDGTPKPESPRLDIPCALCKREGELVVCCGCQLGYHAECADPPFRRSSKGRWRCLNCGGTAAAAPTTALADGGGYSDAGATSKSGGRDQGSDRHSRSSRQAPQSNRAPQKLALKSKGAANDDQIRRSARNLGRDIDYKKHSKYESDDDWETSAPRRPSRRPREDLSDDEYYGMAKRQIPPNRRGASGDVPLDYKICDQLLTEMVRHEDSWHFLRPIGKKELPLYHKVIKCPMDFGTMRSKLNTMTYTDNKQFVTDVFLVFQNCCVFNPANSLQYKAAETLGRLFHRRLRELELPLLTQEERDAMREMPTVRKMATRKRVVPMDWDDSDSEADETEESGYEEPNTDSDTMSERASEVLSESTFDDSEQNGSEELRVETDGGDCDADKESEVEEEEVIVDLEDEIAELEESEDEDENDTDDNGRGCGGRLVIDCGGGDEANDNRSNSSHSHAEH